MYDGKFDLEERLVEFAVRIIKVAGSLPITVAGNHIAGQILRSGTSPAANYGEAQGAESRADFVHIIRIALKENDELISILFKSAATARKNEKTGEQVSRQTGSAE